MAAAGVSDDPANPAPVSSTDEAIGFMGSRNRAYLFSVSQGVVRAPSAFHEFPAILLHFQYLKCFLLLMNIFSSNHPLR
jgi:hypothetical protein